MFEDNYEFYMYHIKKNLPEKEKEEPKSDKKKKKIKNKLSSYS